MARLQWEASCNSPARCTAARSSGVETFIVIKTSTASWHLKSSWNALRSWEQYCTRIFPMTFTTFIKKETEQEFGGKEHTHSNLTFIHIARHLHLFLMAAFPQLLQDLFRVRFYRAIRILQFSRETTRQVLFCQICFDGVQPIQLHGHDAASASAWKQKNDSARLSWCHWKFIITYPNWTWLDIV